MFKYDKDGIFGLLTKNWGGGDLPSVLVQKRLFDVLFSKTRVHFHLFFSPTYPFIFCCFRAPNLVVTHVVLEI